MKKRWRVKSRKSPDPGSPSRSGEPVSPYRSGEPASPYRSVEGTTSAAPSDRGGGGDEGKHWVSRRSPSSGEETAVRPKQKRKQKLAFSSGVLDDDLVGEKSEQKYKAFDRSVKISPPSNRPSLQDAGAVSSVPPPGKKGIKRVVSKRGKKKSSSSKVWVPVLPKEKEEIIKRRLARHVSQSAAAQEKGSSTEETSSGLKVEKKPKPSSEGLHKIAQYEEAEAEEEEEGGWQSDKSPSPVDLSKNAQDEDEQHSDKVGVEVTKDHRQEQGRAEWHVQALLDLDNDTINENIICGLEQLNYAPPKDPYSCAVKEPQDVLFQRLALYRIRGYELSMGRSVDKLDDVDLAHRYPPDILYSKGYFEHYEESLEWYFDPELYEYAGFDDYQRLVVRNDGKYYDWDSYHASLNSYEMDLAYVQYYDAIEKETKWTEDYMTDKTIPWSKLENVAYLLALKIAAGFPNVDPSLLLSGITSLMWRIQFEFWYHKGIDRVYFEIWKRVAKRKMEFTEALSEVYQEKICPSCTVYIKRDMEIPMSSWTMRHKYDAYIAHIGDSISDDEAAVLIKEAVIEMEPRPKAYVDYALKKLEIAKEIGLIKGECPRSTCTTRTPSGQAKAE